MDAFPQVPRFKATSAKTRGKILTIDDEQDPDLIPNYPRITNVYQEDLIELRNAELLFTNRGNQQKDKSSDFLTNVEINFNGSFEKIPESCV